jgi:hypothetical protein
MVWITPGFSSFQVGGPSYSVRSGGTYPVWGVWFPSRLPLEGTGYIQNFWPEPVTYGTQGSRP